MLGIAAMLASCSQGDDLPADANGNETVKVAFNLTTDDVRTRAGESEGTPKQYVVEIYEGENATTGTFVEQKTFGEQNFTMELKKNTTYSFLFWACTDGNVYNTTSLKAVTYASPTAAACEAWCGELLNQTITVSAEPLTAELKHAVAKVVYYNTDALTAASNTLTVTYPSTQTFDVSTKTVTTTESTLIRAYAVTKKGANAIIVTDFLFAPSDGALYTLNVKMNEETGRDIPNVPLQANFVTTIKGAYSNYYESTFTVDSSVEDFTKINHDFPTE